MKSRRWAAPLILALAVCLGNGCAKSRLKVEKLNPTVDPAEQIGLLAADLGEAKGSGVDLLSPAWFAAAETSLNEAREGLAEKEGPSEILLMVSHGRVQLERAEKTAKQTSVLLSDVIRARTLARQAGAMSLGEDYAELEERFLELVREAEKNETEWVKKRSPKVAAGFDGIELRAIKIRTLGEAWTLMRQAEEEGARKALPKSFAAVRKKLGEADAYVAEHRHDREKLQATSTEASFQVNRLIQLNRHAEEIQEMEPEAIVLWIEGILQEATLELGAADMRDKAFAVQEENLLKAIGALKNQRRVLSEKARSEKENASPGAGRIDGGSEANEIIVKEATH